MRPLELEVQGLHSYLEPVRVDFEHLGRYGLFGIFGPIGSGKSSLLDAITLALYGLVDRTAGRGRRGIVHVDADRVEVRLVFGVRDDHGRELRHEVHRIYRETETGAQRVASRLVRLDTGEVLADKERELNQAIEDLIGLNAEDFMRAVVLPQGRFMEVLHLKGSDRRRMLQRIFRLHTYGEVLRRTLRDRQSVARERLAHVRGELDGLGDASEAACRKADAERDAAVTRRTTAAQAAELQRHRYEAARRGREAVRARREAETALAEHEAQRPAIDALASRCHAERTLMPRIGPARRWQAARAERDRADEALRDATAALEAASADRAEAEARRAATVEALQHDEPPLRDAARGLEEAVAWAREQRDQARQVEQLEGQQAEAARRCAKLTASLLAAREALEPLDGRRRALKRELERARVQPEERARVEAVAEARRRVDAAGQERARARDDQARAHAELQAALDRRGRMADEAEAARARLGEAATALAEAAAAAADATPERIAALRERVTTAQRALATAEAHETRRTALVARRDETVRRLEAQQRQADLAAAAVARARERLEGAASALRMAESHRHDHLTDQVVAELAGRLVAGDPCAVCGSTVHPLPAPPHEGADPSPAVEAHRRGREAAAKRLAEAENEQATLEVHREQTRREQASIDTELAGIAEALRALWATVPETEGSDTPDQVAQRVVAEAQRRMARGEQALARVSELREVHAAARVAEAQVSAPEDAVTREIDRARTLADEADRALADADADEAAAWERWSEVAGTAYTLFTVSHAQDALRRRDAEAARLDRDLDALEAERTEQAQRRDALQAEVATMERDAAVLDDRLGSARQRLEALAARLAERTDGVEPEKALADVRAALQRLQSDHAQALQAATKATARGSELEARVAATTARRDAAASAVEAAFDALRQAVPDLCDDEAGRAAVALWADAHVDTAELAVAEARIATWQEEHLKRRARLEALDTPDAPPLDAEAFAELEAQHAAAAAELATATEGAARAEAEAEALRNRAARHAELGATAATLQQLLDRMAHLAQVLRGDRLVDFVANDLLADLARAASEHLARLTDGRYALVVDDDGGFLIRDDDAGGAVRPVHTLSGGEAFLTSLALALALSTEVQAHGPRPLEFFFLDEGFGTLDPEALDRVMTAIESLRDGHRLIGLISHVPSVRERVPRHVLVHPAGTRQKGSAIEVVSG